MPVSSNCIFVETRIKCNGKVDQTVLDRTAFIDCFGQNNQCLTQTFIPTVNEKKVTIGPLKIGLPWK